MEKLIRDLLDQMSGLNSCLGKKALSIDEMEEGEENYIKLLETKIKLETLIKKLKKESGKVVDNKSLMELHVLLDNLSWYFQNLHIQFMKIFKNYPNL